VGTGLADAHPGVDNLALEKGSEMIRKSLIAIVCASVALLGLTACASGTVSADTPAYKVVSAYGSKPWTYACDTGYIPVDIAVGDMTQRDGSSYSLKESKDSAGVQESVTLSIKLADNQQVPVIIVDNAYHAKNEAGGQAIYQPQLQGGSTLTVTLPKEGFGGNTNSPITKVMACTKYSATPKG